MVSEKRLFQCLYVNDIGPRSRNDLDLQYPLTFNNSVNCLHLPTFRSQAANLSEKSTVFTFFFRKTYVIKFDLAVNKVIVNPGSSFEQTMMGWSSRCYMSSFVAIGHLVPEKKIFEVFLYHIWTWRPSWSCDQDAVNKLSFPLPKEAPHKIWL